jgi:AcrR family transcriptional regulator
MSGVREAQRDATRQALVARARTMFAARGYDAVTLAEVVEAAGVTKGALYHHFAGKQALFTAVLAVAQSDVGEAVREAAQRCDDPWKGLVAGCQAFLDACAAPDARQVLLVDGPSVVGWDTWRSLDEQGAGHRLRQALADLMERRLVPLQPLEPLTRALSGAMNELALWSHDVTDGEARQAHDTLDVLLQVVRHRRTEARR